MKQSKYINKYDYINYYTKPKGMWFFSNAEIQSALEVEIKKEKNKQSKYNEWDLEDDFEEIDNDDTEIDYFEYYKECLENNRNLDEDNPLILQGKIIDEKSREYIKNKFININKIVDLEKDYQRLSNEEYAKKTMSLIEENEQIILFQSVFINNNLITKPDAIIKDKDFIFVIETKGTTTAKFVHYLDMFFQMNVIENQEYFKKENMLFNYELCLIEYNILNKYDISFETTENINLKKTVSIPTSHKNYESLNNKELIQLKNSIKKGNSSLNEYVESLKIKDLMYNNISSLEFNIESSKGVSKTSYLKSKNILNNINSSFYDVINELVHHKSKMDSNSIPKFEPSKNDKSDIKNCDFFTLERKLFSLQGYKIFDYSGNIANQNGESLDKVTKDTPIVDFLKKPKKNPNIFIELFSANDVYKINPNYSLSLIEMISSKKVYFDFETINTPIRVIDNSLPFMQVVTQCSIIKYDDNKDELENLKCDNLIIDPQKINIEWFKKVVDGIFWETNNNESVSYIVYNKSFEKTRLLEIDKIINQKEYTIKINSIVNGLFDLADFFKIRSEDPTYCVFFKELGGFYSIKKVLPLIDKYNKEIYQKTKCLNYETLEIKNGQICQTETVKRFFNLINDNNWNHVEKQMQIYCENDVRAMIAVECFIKELMNYRSKNESN